MNKTFSVATVRVLALTLAGLALPSLAFATASTTYWATSVATCQAYATPHVTYDSYFSKKGDFPTDTGLTMGIIPGDKVQAEVGYDLLLPSSNPVGFYLNGKVCVTENAIAKGAPAISVGISSFGFKKDVTSYDVLYATLQKSLPFGGYITIGAYHGLSKTLFFSSEGKKVQNGLLAGWSSPDIKPGIKGISKIDVIADVQTGKNVFGAGGAGLDVYFNDYIGMIVGPVFFLDKTAAGAASSMYWTVQLDVDIPFGKK
jgi:hypothetical protein